MAQKKEKLVILDGNALIHRSFHALPTTIQTKSGVMVNAVYGFTSFLLKAIKEFKPDYLVLTLDKKGPTFRHKKFADYKATRVKAPDELYAQIPIIKKIAQAFNIPIYEKDGFEADDLIGTITKRVNDQVEKIIVTGDMDTLQLINEHTFVFTMSRGIADSVLYNTDEVKRKYGFGPQEVIDYKALRGDPSDNIPGVAGIGEKTATTLIKDFKTLDNIYKHIKSKKIKDRTKQLLIANKEQAYLSKELATIDCDVNIDFSLTEARFRNYEKEKIIKLFSDLEFKSLLSRFQTIDHNSTPEKNKIEQDKFARDTQKFKYHLISTDKEFADFFKKLKKQKEFTFDTETSGLDDFQVSLLGISFSWKEGEAFYLAINQPGVGAKQKKLTLFNYNQAEVKKTDEMHSWLKKLAPLFTDKKIKKFGHNLKFDIKILASFGIKTQGIAFDTMIASYLLNPGNRQHNLDAVVFTELGWEKISQTDLLGSGRQKQDFPEVETEKLMVYSCEDADFTHRLVNKLSLRLKAEKLEKLFNNIEMPLVLVLANMEKNGIKIDQKHFQKLAKEVEEKILKLQKRIWKLAGQEFNIASVQQLREILFEKLKISTAGIGKTKTGFSTGAEELNKLKGEHKIIDLILEFRELSKLNNTYIKALPELVNQVTGRVHTNFNQAVTATGRLSSNHPNLQNIPARTKLGQEIRKGFICTPGTKLVSLDYSQIELRLAAHLSSDKKMIQAFQDGLDIHQSTAAEINNVPLEKVTKEMRQKAKAINFGVLYGQGPRGLAINAGISYQEAKMFIEEYFLIFSGVRKYLDQTIERARKNGFVETLFHRRRYLGDINSSMALVRRSAERMAVNAPLQGSAADIIKVAMIKVDQLLQEKKYKDKVKMLVQVHDELVFEIDDNLIDKAVQEIKNIMENVIKLDVPLLVDIKIGNNWGNIKKNQNYVFVRIKK